MIELFRQMKLPVFDGVHEELVEFNKLGTKKLESRQTEEYKKRRIQLKVKRTKDAQWRKAMIKAAWP